MWLARDESWVVFDTKKDKEIMECPRFDDKVVHLSDEEYEDYLQVRERWYEWQRYLASLLDKD